MEGESVQGTTTFILNKSELWFTYAAVRQNVAAVWR